MAGEKTSKPVPDREARLAQQLRANLRRRKAADRPEPPRSSDEKEG